MIERRPVVGKKREGRLQSGKWQKLWTKLFDLIAIPFSILRFPFSDVSTTLQTYQIEIFHFKSRLSGFQIFLSLSLCVRRNAVTLQALNQILPNDFLPTHYRIKTSQLPPTTFSSGVVLINASTILLSPRRPNETLFLKMHSLT